jgi:hypothetical protein
MADVVELESVGFALDAYDWSLAEAETILRILSKSVLLLGM